MKDSFIELILSSLVNIQEENTLEILKEADILTWIVQFMENRQNQKNYERRENEGNDIVLENMT